MFYFCIPMCSIDVNISNLSRCLPVSFFLTDLQDVFFFSNSLNSTLLYHSWTNAWRHKACFFSLEGSGCLGSHELLLRLGVNMCIMCHVFSDDWFLFGTGEVEWYDMIDITCIRLLTCTVSYDSNDSLSFYSMLPFFMVDTLHLRCLSKGWH